MSRERKERGQRARARRKGYRIPDVITSRHNTVVQRARAARDRRADGLIFVEGLRLCEEAWRAGLVVAEVLFTERVAADPRGGELLAALRRRTDRLSEVSEGVLTHVSDTETPQGIVLLAARPPDDRSSFERRLPAEPLVVVLHGVGNPSNAGASVRVAEAAGAAGVIATKGCADLLSPKALRSAMGSCFRLPLWAGSTFAEATGWCRGRGIAMASTDLSATQSHTDVDWRGAKAILCGSEAGGLSESEILSADVRVRIPMREPVESLNVAVALGVVLYEAARQRGLPAQP